MKQVFIVFILLLLITTSNKPFAYDEWTLGCEPTYNETGFSGDTLIPVESVACNPEPVSNRDSSKVILGISFGKHCKLKAISEIQEGDLVECWSSNSDSDGNESLVAEWKPVTAIHHYTSPNYYLLITSSADTFVCGGNQEFYDYFTNCFLPATIIHQIINEGGRVALTPRRMYGFKAEVIKTLKFNQVPHAAKYKELYALEIAGCNNLPLGWSRLMAHDRTPHLFPYFGQIYFEHLSSATAAAVFQHIMNKLDSANSRDAEILKSLQESYGAKNTTQTPVRLKHGEDFFILQSFEDEGDYGIYPLES